MCVCVPMRASVAGDFVPRSCLIALPSVIAVLDPSVGRTTDNRSSLQPVDGCSQKHSCFKSNPHLYVVHPCLLSLSYRIRMTC